MSIGRAVPVIHIKGVASTIASKLGLPPGQFPAKIRMSDDKGQARWFEFQGYLKTHKCAVYTHEGKPFLVLDDQEGK